MHSTPKNPHRPRILRTSFVVLGAVLIGSLAGCGSSSPSSAAGTKSNPEQLTLAIAWTGTQAAGVPPLLQIYNQEHPDVHWNLVENVTEQKLLAEEAAGDAPSVAMLDTTNLVASMATSGAILPLQSDISSAGLNMNQFTPASLYSNTYLGAQYALPFFEDTYALYYNKTLFAKAGIAQPPTTLSQLAADAMKLSITGSNGQYTQLGFEPTMPKELEGYLYGGNWATSSGQVTATSPLAEEGVQWLVNVEKELDPSKVQRFMSSASGAVSALDPFATGKVAMDISGEWFMPTILQESPNMDFGVAPIPYPDGDPQYANTGSVGGNPLVILKGAKDPSASWDLIDWLATTGQEIATKNPTLFHDIYSVPALKSLVSDAKLAPTPQMAFFWQYSGSANIHPFPPVPDATTYLNAISSAVQDAQLTSESVSAALQQVQNQYAPLIASQIKSASAQ
jgi:multiple sugar transport system substrate-binding protein